MPKIELTTDQLKALADYAREHGRYWKAALLRDWGNGRVTVWQLQWLRNAYGPRWLAKFRLPK